MSLDPFIHPDTEIQALLQLTGVQAWKLWAPDAERGTVYLTLRMDYLRCDAKIYWREPVEVWRVALAQMLDKIREVPA